MPLASMAPVTVPRGYHFHPTDEQLISYYLKSKVEGKSIPAIPDMAMEEVELYGPSETKEPWKLFGEQVNTANVSFYVFSKLETTSRSSKKIRRVAGRGTWDLQNSHDVLRSGDPNKTVIGLKRMFRFEMKHAKEKVPRWIMHEYTLSGVPHYALCEIKHIESEKAVHQHHRGKNDLNLADYLERRNGSVLVKDDDRGKRVRVDNFLVTYSFGTDINFGGNPNLVPPTQGLLRGATLPDDRGKSVRVDNAPATSFGGADFNIGESSNLMPPTQGLFRGAILPDDRGKRVRVDNAPATSFGGADFNIGESSNLVPPNQGLLRGAMPDDRGKRVLVDVPATDSFGADINIGESSNSAAPPQGLLRGALPLLITNGGGEEPLMWSLPGADNGDGLLSISEEPFPLLENCDDCRVGDWVDAMINFDNQEVSDQPGSHNLEFNGDGHIADSSGTDINANAGNFGGYSNFVAPTFQQGSDIFGEQFQFPIIGGDFLAGSEGALPLPITNNGGAEEPMWGLPGAGNINGDGLLNIHQEPFACDCGYDHSNNQLLVPNNLTPSACNINANMDPTVFDPQPCSAQPSTLAINPDDLHHQHQQQGGWQLSDIVRSS